VIVVAVALALPLTASTAPKADWKCIAGICVGTSRAEIGYRFNRYGGPETSLWWRVRVGGGRVFMTFFKEVDAVALDNITRTNFVTKVETCDPIVRLPDGVTIGTKIPFGNWWRGYKFGYGGDPYGPIWQKRIHVGSRTIRVRLIIEKGRVVCVSLSRLWPGFDPTGG
jgi:hypothetical protein